MKAVITVVGKDKVGILAKVSGKCASMNANVLDVTQTILQDMFVMIMMVDISGLNCEFSEMASSFEKLGEELGLSIHAMHEDIFNSMHRI